MSELVAEQPVGLSEGARVGNVFVAPTKTFTDIRRNASWWLPFVLMLLVGFFFSYSVDKKVGFDAVAQKIMDQTPMLADRVASMNGPERAQMMAQMATRTRYQTYGFSVFILVWGLLVSLLYWATINFVMGAQTKFKEVLAMWMYGALPGSLKALLAACLLWAGVGNEGFDIKNPIGTNPAYYLQGAGAAVKSAMQFLDVFGLWTLALMVIGLATISGKSKGQAAGVVVGWWALGLAVSTALAAAFN